MRAPLLGSCLLAAAGFLAGCVTTSDAGDGGDAGVLISDAGTDGGVCSATGESCDPVLSPCCSTSDQCLLASTAGLICIGPLVDAGSDAGIQDAGPDAGLQDAGPADAGVFDAGPLPDAGPIFWVLLSIPDDVTTLFGLAVPDPGLVLAVGRSLDGGLLLEGNGAPDASLQEVAGLPASQVLSGVWSDPSADVVLLAGRNAQGGTLLLGTLADGGGFDAQVDGGTPALLDCWGDDQGNLYAVGVGGSGGLVLREPSGGTFTPESIPAGLTTVYRITGGAGLYALAVDNTGSPQILARVAGSWTEIAGVPVAVHFADLALEPDGTLVVVGDDGLGGGLGYLYSADAGSLLPLPLPTTLVVPKLHAVTILPSGEIYLGAGGSEPGVPATPFLLHAADGGWTQENLPFGISTLNQLGNAGPAALFAVGTVGTGGALLKRSP